MSVTRSIAISFSLLLAAGCGSGGSVAPSATPQQPQSALPYPAESSAARQILANVGRGGASVRTPAGWNGGDEDDGDLGELQLPAIQPCGNGTYATDCTAWLWTRSGPGGPRSGARSAQSVAVGTPPVLNFCRDASLIPLDLTTAPVVAAAPTQFSLSYAGTKAPPIVTFATRWWNLGVQGSFTGTATTAPAITATPALTDAASRGWLAFFTWSWPADILLVPYAIDEIQVEAASSPLAVPPGGSAALRAFDCLGRKIAARKRGSGFGFSADLRAASAGSAASELNALVYGGSNPNGTISLSDDRGARATVTVVPGTPAPR